MAVVWKKIPFHWQQFEVKQSDLQPVWNQQTPLNIRLTFCDSRFSRCHVNWLKITCVSERLKIVPNKVLGANLPSLSLSLSRSQFDIMFCSRLLFGKSWETPEFQVVSAMLGCWQDCQLQTRSQSNDTAAPVAYCDYFARYCEWKMTLVDLRSSLFMRGKKEIFFSAGDKNKILSFKLDLSVI